jgi:hypothetical protein
MCDTPKDDRDRGRAVNKKFIHASKSDMLYLLNMCSIQRLFMVSSPCLKEEPEHQSQRNRREASKQREQKSLGCCWNSGEHDSQGSARGVRRDAAQSSRAGDGNALAVGEPPAE